MLENGPINTIFFVFEFIDCLWYYFQTVCFTEWYPTACICMFQGSLFFRITTLLSWLKSTLLLKNKCFDMYTYLYENIMFTNKMRCSIIWKGNAWKAGWVRKVLVLIKNLIYMREEEDVLEVRLNKIDQSRSKLSADTCREIILTQVSFNMKINTGKVGRYMCFRYTLKLLFLLC